MDIYKVRPRKDKRGVDLISMCYRLVICGTASRKPSQMLWDRDSAVGGGRVVREVVWLFPLRPEVHSHSVGAGLGSSITHLVHEASPASDTGGISVGTIVWRCRDHHAIAVDVDVG
jgi:hypothetical protein